MVPIIDVVSDLYDHYIRFRGSRGDGGCLYFLYKLLSVTSPTEVGVTVITFDVEFFQFGSSWKKGWSEVIGDDWDGGRSSDLGGCVGVAGNNGHVGFVGKLEMLGLPEKMEVEKDNIG
ncbi:unnamed protein product [Lactuca virosa]|uniref:Uncharacterized protein n=1 Tax=Lactuca virosa TaxID=75947 RepID=A0AAU9MJK1_9ASTR|nr:unnamed protein product [Lactuca virosa]